MKPAGLKEIAYNQIKQMLLDGTIKPGDRIREDLLAQQISVSRTPVREAINQLIVAGFVKDVPRHGLFAMKFSPKELADIGTVRSVLSSLAIEQCCANLTPDKEKQLTKAYHQLMDACENGDFSQISWYDGMFHKTIAKLSGNEKLHSYICDLEDLLIYSRQMDNYSYSIDNLIQAHQQIYQSILSKNSESTEEIMSWRNVKAKYKLDSNNLNEISD